MKESFSGLERKSKIIGKVYVCDFFFNKTLVIHMDWKKKLIQKDYNVRPMDS